MADVATRPPQFNHVAMSLPADALSEEGRADITRFYSEVFGFEEYDILTKDREQLVLRAYSHEQFVFLIADDSPRTCPRMDHFGMSVSTMDEFEDLLAKCKAFREHDDRVDLVDRSVEDYYGALKLHSFYVRYLFPMMIEVQFFEWQ